MVSLFENVYLVDADHVPLLIGEETMTSWKVVLDMGKNTITIDLGKPLCFDCETTSSGHKAVKLFRTGEWTTNETVFFMSKESDLHTYQKIKKIHEVTNHKGETSFCLPTGMLIN